MIFARKPASDNGSSSLRCHGDKTATFVSCPPERKNLGPAACLWLARLRAQRPALWISDSVERPLPARPRRSQVLRRRSLGQTDSGRSSLAAETGLHAPQPTFAPMVFVLRRAARSPRELVAEHRQAADGCFLCHLVLDDVPVLGQLAVLEAHDIHHDPVRRPA